MTYNIVTNLLFTVALIAALIGGTKMYNTNMKRRMRTQHQRVMRSHASAERIVSYRGMDNLNR